MNPESGRRAVALLATFFVVTAGLFACVFIIVMFDSNPRDSLLACAGAFTVAALLAWLLRDKPPGSVAAEKHFWLRKSQAERNRGAGIDLAQLKFHRPREAQADAKSPPAPPSVESVREIIANTNVWVPSETRGREPDAAAPAPPRPDGVA